MSKIYIIDRTGLKFNQICIVLSVATAFILNLPWLTGIVAAVLLAGTFFPKAGLFKLFYTYVVKKSGLLKPVISEEDMSPHLFAQGLGGIFLTLSYLLLTVFNLSLLGWIFSIAVLFLALLNLTFNFCLGCFIYYQLQKSGLFSAVPEAKRKNAL